MNEKSKFDGLVKDLDDLKPIDISRKVMHRINEIRTYTEKPRRRQKPVILVASIFFIITFVSAGAVYAFSDNWNGILLSLTEQSPGNVNQMESIERVDQWLKEEGTIKEEYNLISGEDKLGFEFLTAKETTIPLNHRFAGLIHLNIPDDINKTETNDKTLDINANVKNYTPTIIDFYRQQNEWVLVIQSKDSDATKAVQGMVKLSNNYVGNWNVIKNTGNILAVYSDGGKEKNISLSVLTSNKTVVGLQITGNVTEESLKDIMEGYIADIK